MGGATQSGCQSQGIELQVVKVDEAKKDFVCCLSVGWERSFAWAARFRRMAKEYEQLPAVLHGLHFLVFAILMLPEARASSAMSG